MSPFPVLLKRLSLASAWVLVFFISGCATVPPATPPAPTPVPVPAPPPVPPPAPKARPTPERAAGAAKIKGSEESSMLLDDFTSFVSAVDGVPVAAGRKGWSTPLEIKAGRRILTVEFVRGVFSARANLKLEAAAGANYEVRFTTDAQLFGHNSFCDFWVVDLGTGKTVCAVTKAPVRKNN
jgi:hypothetical protein